MGFRSGGKLMDQEKISIEEAMKIGFGKIPNNCLKMNKKPKFRQIAGRKGKRKFDNVFKSVVRRMIKRAAKEGRPIKHKRNRKVNK